MSNLRKMVRTSFFPALLFLGVVLSGIMTPGNVVEAVTMGAQSFGSIFSTVEANKLSYSPGELIVLDTTISPNLLQTLSGTTHITAYLNNSIVPQLACGILAGNTCTPADYAAWKSANTVSDVTFFLEGQESGSGQISLFAPTNPGNYQIVIGMFSDMTGATLGDSSYTNIPIAVSALYSCTGAIPANAVIHAGDDVGLSADTARAFSAANTAPKCQYTCSAGYTWDGSACVLPVTPINGACAATHYSCTAGISANTVSGAASYTWNCNGTSGGTNASCSEVKPTGTVVVTSNILASWTITGPAVIAGAGTIQTSVSKPVGVYTITWGAVSGYATPAPSSLTLVDGGIVSFNGMYTPAPCSAGTTLNWSVGGNTCTGTTPATNSGLSGAITDSTLPTTGSAAFSCTNGAWAAMPNAGATCGTQPDLTATNVTPAAASSFLNNAAITFTGTAINSAAAAVAQGGWADLEIDWHSDSATFDTNRNAYSNVQLGAFAVNQTKPLSYTLAAGTAPAGTHRYRFNVDTTNTLGESNETNNQSAWVTFSVTAAPPSIDLTVAGCSILAGANECTTALTTWTYSNGTPDYQIKNDTIGDIIYTGANGNSSAAGTRLTYGPNTIYGYHNNDFAAGNHIGSFTAEADCVSGTAWSGITNRCELAPSLTITANPNLIRYDSSTSVTVTTTSTNSLTCDIYGATIAPQTDILLDSVTSSYTIPQTKNIKAKQQVLVECFDSSTGLTGSSDTYIEVLPKIQEV